MIHFQNITNLKKLIMGSLTLTQILFIFVGLYLIGRGIFQLLKKYCLIIFGQRTEGLIIAYEFSKNSYDKKYDFDRIQYYIYPYIVEYKLDGKIQKATSMEALIVNQLIQPSESINQDVTIYYLPNQPGIVSIKGMRSVESQSIKNIIFGIVFIYTIISNLKHIL